MQQTQREQLEFIENFATMISSTFTKFANLCRQQINVTKNNQTQASSAKPTMQIPKAASTVQPQKVSQPTKNTVQNTQTGVGKPQIRKPHNALSLFISDERQKILRQNPNLQFMQVTQRASAKWKNMSEQEKKPYLQRYEILKNNYQKQKDNFDPDEQAEKQQSKKAIKQNKIAQKAQIAQSQQKQSQNPESNSPLSTNQVVPTRQTDPQSKKMDLSNPVQDNQQAFESPKDQQKDDYEQIKFSQDDKQRPVQVIQIPQTQNEA